MHGDDDEDSYPEVMQFTDEELQRLRRIFKDVFDLEISEAEALEHATKLLTAGQILTDPNSYPDSDLSAGA